MSENNLSARIRELRAKHGLTLEQVAQQVGVGRSTVRKWETGLIENMRRDKIAKLAIALHTTPAYLMGWEDSPSSDFTSLLLESSGYWDGERLAELRNERGYSIKQISSWLEISDTEYKYLESSAAEPSFKLLLRLADIFAFDLDYLCHRTTKSESSIHNELEILNLYCKLDDTGKASACAALKGLLDAFPGEETISTSKEA